MRRVTILLSALLLGLATMTASAVAMEPPAEAAADRFGCVEGEDGPETDPVGGHPGAVGEDGGIVHATALVAGKKAGFVGDVPEEAADQAGARPTAWAAVDNAEPIELGGC